MAYEQKDNSGALFVNTKKQKDSHPDYNGTCVVDGVEKQIGGWKKKSKSGLEYLSISFSEPYKKDEGNSSPSGGAF